ncbi:MAG: hypothetical protein FWF11_00705 [Coriobacteriia bacterium]|nr:hypothetical protein [Coriobacteriia bacterium]
MKSFVKSVLAVLIVALLATAVYYSLDYLNQLDLQRAQLPTESPDPEEPSIYPYIIPMEGPAVTPATFSFAFMGVDYEIQAQVDHRIYHGAVTAPRGYLLAPAATKQERLAAVAQYYNMMTFDPEMDDALESVLLQLRSIRDDRDFDSDQYVDMIVKFVQSVPYDLDRGLVAHDSSFLGDPRLPVQVLVDGRGDCDELVMLLAALLAKEGYDTAALFFEAEMHMALGIKSDGEGFEGTDYEFIETTGISYVSEVPTEFIGGIELQSFPEVLVFDPNFAAKKEGVPEEDWTSQPTGFYSQAAVAQVRRIIAVRDSAEAAAESKRAEIESTPMTPAEFERQTALYEACFTAMNGLRATVDSLGRDTGDFMDRVTAIAWIENNAWWE